MPADYEDLLEDYQVVTHRSADLLEQIAEELKTKQHPTSEERHAILIHSSLRASRVAKACILLSGRKFAEEIFALSRTLAEVCVNAAYLQISSEQELSNYVTHDPAKNAVRLKKMTAQMPRNERASASEQAKMGNLSSSDLAVTASWSAMTLSTRAREVDKVRKTGALMNNLAVFVYEMGHTHVHGTASSVVTIGNWFLDGADETSEERFRATAVALSNCAVCLSALSAFITERYALKSRKDVENLLTNLRSLGHDQ